MYRHHPEESPRTPNSPGIEDYIQDFGNLPLRSQLAIKLDSLGLAGKREGAPNPSAPHYTKEFAVRALEAVQDGSIRGRMALRIAENEEMLLRTALPRTVGYRLLNHGSPYEMATILPRQASWQDNKRRRYRDGKEAICASETTRLPAIRAMLHDARVSLDGISLVLAKRHDKSGRAHWFTSEEAIDAVTPFNGFVYTLQAEPPKWVRSSEKPYDYFADREEYRIYGERVPLLRTRVGVEDLPPDLYVVADSDRGTLQSLPQFNSPREWSDITDTPLRPLGGTWPLEDFPEK